MTETPDGGISPGGRPAEGATPQGADDPWARAIDRALRGEGFALAFQPIVDLQHAAVVGYEALSRFDGAPAGVPNASPPEWFGRARTLGVLPELEARVLSRALDARDRLPPNTFLTVNVSPEAFSSDLVRRVLFSPRGLHRVVVEITGAPAVPRAPGRPMMSRSSRPSRASAPAAPTSPWTTAGRATRAWRDCSSCGRTSSNSTARW